MLTNILTKPSPLQEKVDALMAQNEMWYGEVYGPYLTALLIDLFFEEYPELKFTCCARPVEDQLQYVCFSWAEPDTGLHTVEFLMEDPVPEDR